MLLNLGKAIESNEINANELATSLLGLSNTIEKANSILNGSDSKMFVKVHDSFRSGSFIVNIASFLSPNFVQTVFNSGTIVDTTASVVTILGFVGFCAYDAGAVAHRTLIWLYIQTKGKKSSRKNRWMQIIVK